MENKEWLAWRKKGIGSSDSNILAGLSEFKTPLDLYEDKISDEIKEHEGNFITDLGHEVEAKIRTHVECLEGIPFSPELMEMETYPYMKASLDGWNAENKFPLEIKLLGKEHFENMQKGIPPAHYMPQFQKIMLVSGAEVCIVAGALYKQGDNKNFPPDRICVLEVPRDEKYQKALFKRDSDFWFKNVLVKKPPELSDADFKRMPNMSKWANAFKKAKEALKKYESAEKEARAFLMEAADKMNHPRLMANGVRIVKVERSDSFDYDAMPQLAEINRLIKASQETRQNIIDKIPQDKILDEYIIKGTSYWKLDIPKPKKEK